MVGEGYKKRVKKGERLKENLVIDRGFLQAEENGFPGFPPGRHHTCPGLVWATAIYPEQLKHADGV